jgi:hypothetical protein
MYRTFGVQTVEQLLVFTRETNEHDHRDGSEMKRLRGLEQALFHENRSYGGFAVIFLQSLSTCY